MKNRSLTFRSLAGMLIIATSLFVTVGCQPGDDGDAVPNNSQKLPKLRFNKPKTFDVAVKRMAEIQENVMTDDPLPAPKIFKVVETIHGSGPGAHSHYHLASNASEHSHDDDSAHSHGHDDIESDEKIHEVQVDVFTEFVDIVKWLPNIAGDSDMDKDDWDKIKKDSSVLHKTLTEKLSTAKTTEEKRESLRELNESIVEFSTALSSIGEQLNREGDNQPNTTEN